MPTKCTSSKPSNPGRFWPHVGKQDAHACFGGRLHKLVHRTVSQSTSPCWQHQLRTCLHLSPSAHSPQSASRGYLAPKAACCAQVSAKGLSCTARQTVARVAAHRTCTAEGAKRPRKISLHILEHRQTAAEHHPVCSCSRPSILAWTPRGRTSRCGRTARSAVQKSELTCTHRGRTGSNLAKCESICRAAPLRAAACLRWVGSSPGPPVAHLKTKLAVTTVQITN